MKRTPFFWIMLMLLMAGCNKDKFTTEPQVEVKSIQPSTVTNGAIIRLLSDYTDDEGDLASALVVYKWFNGTTASRVDTLIRFSFTRLNIHGSATGEFYLITFTGGLTD